MNGTATTRLALKYLREGQAYVAQYQEACEQWAKDGHRPAQCIHGTNLWTDYDPICGPCEDGHRYDDRAYCLALARNAVAEQQRRINVVTPLLSQTGLPDGLLDLVLTWVSAPIHH